MTSRNFIFVFTICLISSLASAQHSHSGMNSTSHKMAMSAKDCTKDQVWDHSMGSCRQLAMLNMPMAMWMVHANAFLVQTASQGPRGYDYFAAPNILMLEGGKSAGDRHYLDVNLMLTLERWTFPKSGYPETFQIGEKNENEQPYIDAQHPHSSPIMGLTLSDTIRLGEGTDYLRLFIAPRGQATEGPTAFMHRPTGMINPDAPLGHHIGQDVSHITSTVVGSSLGLGKTVFEISAFNGTEPEPAKVDLPVGPLNSYAGRIIYQFSEDVTLMASGAFVKDPEPHDPTLEKVTRYTLSSSVQHGFDSGWMLHNTFIYGLIHNYDHIGSLRSLLYEFWLHSSDSPSNFWGRIEVLERTGSQLGITVGSDLSTPKWISAVTAGYTYDLVKFESSKVSLGGSITKSIAATEFKDAYGGDPLSGKIFIQIGGMKMGSF